MVGVWLSSWTGSFKGSTLAPFVQATPSASVLGAAALYAFIATGCPEELLFRGLIAGALFRRMVFWKANLVQALIFAIPHLLVLFVAPQLWPVAIGAPLGLGLFVGWLRARSGSIWPGAIVHAGSNLAGALAVMHWSR